VLAIGRQIAITGFDERHGQELRRQAMRRDRRRYRFLVGSHAIQACVEVGTPIGRRQQKVELAHDGFIGFDR